MPTIRVVSWNIQTLGEARSYANGEKGTGPSQFIAFIAEAVKYFEADIVGIMEIQSGAGSDIKNWLVPALNGAVNPPTSWMGRVSTRQTHNPNEEYLYLWKNQPGALELDSEGMPGPTSLIGVVDDNAMEYVYEKTGIVDESEKQQLFTALQKSGYIKKEPPGKKKKLFDWRVEPDKWDELDIAGPSRAVVFDSKYPPPRNIGTAPWPAHLADQLLQIDILRFTTYGERSPFLANFRVASKKKLLISLLHAPKPRASPWEAVNIMSLSTPMSDLKKNLLIMGDFNVDANYAQKSAPMWGRILTRNGAFGFDKVSGSSELAFGPIKGRPLKAIDLIGNQKTSLKSRLPSAPPEDDILSKDYDKFFFRQSNVAGQEIAQSKAEVRNLVKDMAECEVGTPQEQQAKKNLTLAAIRRFREGRGWSGTLKRSEGRVEGALKSATNVVTKLEVEIGATKKKIVADKKAKKDTRPTEKRLMQLEEELEAAEEEKGLLEGQKAALAEVRELLTPNTATTINTIGASFWLYMKYISDHLPISVQLDG